MITFWGKRKEFEPTTIQDRIKGVIYGHAIGDAIGLGTEFLNREQVLMNYPNGFESYDQIIQDKHRSRWQKGEWTDDTDQMLCVLESILENKTVEKNDVARRIHKWAYSGGRGLGNTVYKVISSMHFHYAPHEVAKQVWLKSEKNAAANGAVMRTSILGVWDYNNAIRRQKNTEEIAKVTHFDPRCVGSCVAVTYAIAELIRGETDYKKLHKDAMRKALELDMRIEPFMKLSQEKAIRKLELDEKNAIGYTLKALAAGFWALQQADYKRAMVAIINQGGDADTNGAVAGGIMGAKFGYSGLPKDWVEGLQNKNKLDALIEQLILKMKETNQLS